MHLARKSLPFVLFVGILAACSTLSPGCGSNAPPATEPTGTQPEGSPVGGPEVMATGAVKAVGLTTSLALLETLDFDTPLSPPSGESGLNLIAIRDKALFDQCVDDFSTGFSCPQGGSLDVTWACDLTSVATDCNLILEDLAVTMTDCGMDGYRFADAARGGGKLTVLDCDPCGALRLLIVLEESMDGISPDGNPIAIAPGSQWRFSIAGDPTACGPRTIELSGFLGSVFVGETVTCQFAGQPDLTAADCFVDADRDSVDDAIDNCPGAANPDQADRDRDGTGDVCGEAPEGIFICKPPCELLDCQSVIDCGPSAAGLDCVDGCCVEATAGSDSCAPCATDQDCPKGFACTDACCVAAPTPEPTPEPPPSLKAQELPPPPEEIPLPGSECVPGSDAEQVAADCGAPDCLCAEDGFCICLTLPAGCGDCFLQPGEECETGDHCPECGIDRHIPEAQCGPGSRCNKETCICEPSGGAADFCPDDCEGIDTPGVGTCEERFGLGSSFCYAPGCPQIGSLGAGVYCAADPFLAGTGEGICEGLEGALTGLVTPLPEIDCGSQGAYACCVAASGNFCPGLQNCSAAGGVCEERQNLGNSFCWTDSPDDCPPLTEIGLGTGVYCEGNENTCEALESTAGSSVELDCVEQKNGKACCVAGGVPPPPSCPLGGPPPPQCASNADCESFMGPGATCADGCCSPPPPAYEYNCFDGIDDDTDGKIDCDDSDCEFVFGCHKHEFAYVDCNDGSDNDGDGLTDCDDVDDCQFDPTCQKCPITGNPPGECGFDVPCAEGQFCDFNLCCRASVCGDFFCDPSESCSGCPGDCGPCAVCGDAFCALGETCESCPSDCGTCPPPGCGDNVCDAKFETCETCSLDCGRCPL
ncbi:MAG TPA: hypothetical protein VLJ37_03575 [bacterium]|nr:hypothetical protein [bacterium]